MVTREDFKNHCIKTIAIREKMNKNPNIHFESDKVYQEHKMTLELIEKMEQIEELIDSCTTYYDCLIKIKRIVKGEE